MTLGELATMFNGELQTGADLTVIAMRGYRRELLVRWDGAAVGQPFT